tara:strand:+ start:231 stop:698 length:468 start_codon:yes stop_codon:yes gene_type:complete
MADSLASAPAAPVTPTAAAGARKRKAEKTLEADTVARGGHGTALVTRGAAEQGRLICWLLYVAAASSLPSGVLVGHHCQRSAQAQHLPEVAGERQVEAEHSDKLAESLPVRDRVDLDLELRRHQPLLRGDRARQSVASERSCCPGKIFLSDFAGS